MASLESKIGHTIRTLRMAKGLTQEQLVEACNDFSVSTLSRYEHGESIKVQNLEKLANALGTTMAAIVCTAEYSTQINADAEKKYKQFLEIMKHPSGSHELRQDFPIQSLSDFIIYLPLIPMKNLIRMLHRVSGETYKREDYILNLLRLCYLRIDTSLSNARRWADFQVENPDTYFKVLEYAVSIEPLPSNLSSLIKPHFDNLQDMLMCYYEYQRALGNNDLPREALTKYFSENLGIISDEDYKNQLIKALKDYSIGCCR